MNPVATGALLAMALAQLIVVVILWEPPPQEMHFRAISKYCREAPAVVAGGPEAYFECVAHFAIK
jgi:hypothetical protein